MIKIILVGLGGFAGASARYLLGRYIGRSWKGGFPLGTFTVNVIGSFLLGVMVFNPQIIWAINKDLYLLSLGSGFLGSFTTFSTFQYETLQLFEKGKTATALAYVLLSLGLGLAAAWLST